MPKPRVRSNPAPCSNKRRRIDSSAVSTVALGAAREDDREPRSEGERAGNRELHKADSAAAALSGSVSADTSSLSSAPPSPSSPAAFFVGTASWSIPRSSAASFAADGSHLQRYSSRLPCVELNSSFYRHHQASTYRKWAALTPPHFRFAVKLNRHFTHTQRLAVEADELRPVLDGLTELGDKLAVLLIQLPPSLRFEQDTASAFFDTLRSMWRGVAVVEARHASWGEAEASAVLAGASVGRVVADPDRCPAPVVASCPVAYYRLHGSPIVYKSEYSAAALDGWLARMRADERAGRTVWCAFDNTALGAATANALQLLDMRAGRAPEMAVEAAD